jgi:hypothetical protein
VCFLEVRTSYTYKESKTISVTGRGDLEVCEMLRIPHCLEFRFTEGGEFLSLIHRQRSSSQKHFLFLPLMLISIID